MTMLSSRTGVTKPHLYPVRQYGSGHLWYVARIRTPDGYYHTCERTAKAAYDALLAKLKAKGLYWEVFP